MTAEQRRDRDELKAALSDPQRVARALGIAERSRPQPNGITTACPLHDDGKNSLSIVKGDHGGLIAVCHAGCFKGDELNLIAAVERLNLSSDFPAVLARAREIAGIAERTEPRPVKPAVDVVALWESLPPLDAPALAYLAARNLEKAAHLCRGVPEIGAGDLTGMRLAVAMRDRTGRIVAIQARDFVEGKAHGFKVCGTSGAAVFGDPARLSLATMRFVFVAEGLTDFLAASIAVGASDKATAIGIAGVNNVGECKALTVKGLRVLVATDADDAGDKCAAGIIAAHNAAGAVAVRARPEGAKDLCDMRAAGVDLRAWFGKACKIDLGFKNFGQRIEGERAARLADGGRALSFGVGYLDAALGGIMPRDIVLIGAESGYGKTELVTLIGMTCARAGKRVHYFALEPEPVEIERRIKFKLLSVMVFANRVQGAERFNFQDWRDGKCDHLSGQFETEADRILSKQYEHLHTFYRSEKGDDFTPGDFDRMARALGDDTDLIILDHVHYFDDDDDANRGQKRTARKIRDMAITTGRPVVEVAHLRKKQAGNRKAPRLIPERDDFEGSSHLFKPVKKAIILAPARDHKSQTPWVWPTYFAVVKNTFDGSRCRYVGLVGFNARTNCYEDDFQIGELEKNGEKFTFVDYAKLPLWAKPQPAPQVPRTREPGDDDE